MTTTDNNAIDPWVRARSSGSEEIQDRTGRMLEDAARVRLFGHQNQYEENNVRSSADCETTIAMPKLSSAGDLNQNLTRGAVVGRYLVLGTLGAGGMGVVYAAYDPELDRKLALKFVAPRVRGDLDSTRSRLLREAQALAKLSHPNVVTIHDVGFHGDRVWIAMEFVAGQTLTLWSKQKRQWPELIRVLTDVARAVAAAHATGIVHRDLKPDNVMISEDGRVRVLDFGLAHGRFLPGGTEIGTDSDTGNVLSQTIGTDSRMHPEFAALTERLTQAGAVQGTPAYMAPEQWRGCEADAMADQFSWSVTAWEILYGERPFAGETLIALGQAVLSGEPKPPPKDRSIPTWMRKVLERGLASDSSRRWPTMVALLAALEVGTRRARMKAAITILIGTVASIYGAVVYIGAAQRAEYEAIVTEIEGQVAQAQETIISAQTLAGRAEWAREQAFERFDSGDSPGARGKWGLAEAELDRAHILFREGTSEMTAAFNRNPKLDGTRDALLASLYEHALVMDKAGRGSIAEDLYQRIDSYDEEWATRRMSSSLTITGTTIATAAIGKFEPSRESGYDLKVVDRVEARRLGRVSLQPGSYLITLSSVQEQEVLYPVIVHLGEDVGISPYMPERIEVPEGFVYVPPGRFTFGSNAPVEARRVLSTSPARQLETGAFLIANTETTNAEYIEYLNAQPPDVRSVLLSTPEVSSWDNGLGLSQLADGTWLFNMPVGRFDQSAPLGTKIDLASGAVVDWAELPVAGLTWSEAQAYLAWLDLSGKFPGARFCTEWEWERAARGADARIYPHGDVLLVGDANFDTEEGHRRPGLNVVASYPASDSPFGLHDMAGSVLEWVSSGTEVQRSGLSYGWSSPSPVVWDSDGEFTDVQVARGGSYLLDKTLATTVGRHLLNPHSREMKVGLRVCADFVIRGTSG